MAVLAFVVDFLVAVFLLVVFLFEAVVALVFSFFSEVVTLVDTFTIFGQVVIMLLVQIGGLRIHANYRAYAYDTWQKNNT